MLYPIKVFSKSMKHMYTLRVCCQFPKLATLLQQNVHAEKILSHSQTIPKAKFLFTYSTITQGIHWILKVTIGIHPVGSLINQSNQSEVAAIGSSAFLQCCNKNKLQPVIWFVIFIVNVIEECHKCSPHLRVLEIQRKFCGDLVPYYSLRDLLVFLLHI